MPTFTNLGDLIVRDRDLSKIAVVDLGGEESPREFSYLELDAMANGVARALTKRGFARGDRIAILSANRAEFIAAYFGIMRAGFVAVPVNFKFPQQTIHFIIKDSGAKLVFCDAQRRKDCPGDLPAVVFGAEGAESFDTFLDDGPFDAIVPAQGEPAMFLYTSGSTGTPKGVVLSHQSHIWVVNARLAPGLDQHRYLIAAPLYHMNALALSKLACAAHATIVLLPQFTARAYIEAIERYRATWLTAVPPMMAMMLRETDLMASTDLSSVQFVRMGSAPVSQSLMQAIHRALPKAAVTNAYGTTEAGPVVFGPHPKGLQQPEMSVGYPHPQVQLRLVDGDNRDADAGRAGDEVPGGDERLSQPAGRAAADHQGRLLHHRRRVPPRRRRLLLLSSAVPTTCSSPAARTSIPPTSSACWSVIPAVAQAAVVPVDDDIKGQKPVAFVIPKAGQSPSEDEIKKFALANAPAYQHPRFVWFVDELPLASTNKVDRSQLIGATAEGCVRRGTVLS